MQNTPVPPAVAAQSEAQASAVSDDELLKQLAAGTISADDLPPLDDDDDRHERAKIELVPVIWPGRGLRTVAIKRLTGSEALQAILDAAKTGAQDVNSIYVLKLTRCVVKGKDDPTPRYSQRSALHLITEQEASKLDALLKAIHNVNPQLKNL